MLITSKSSFSWVPAFYASPQSTVVVFTRFWHLPLRDWIVRFRERAGHVQGAGPIGSGKREGKGSVGCQPPRQAACLCMLLSSPVTQVVDDFEESELDAATLQKPGRAGLAILPKVATGGGADMMIPPGSTQAVINATRVAEAVLNRVDRLRFSEPRA